MGWKPSHSCGLRIVGRHANLARMAATASTPTEEAVAGLPRPLRDPALLCDDLFVDGAFQASAGGERFDVRDPATGGLIARVASGTREDARRAVEAAKAAMPAWAAATAKERAAVLRRWFDLMVEHADDLAAIL